MDAVIANASHDGLLRVGNIAHQQVCYQLIQVQNEGVKHKKEAEQLAWYRCVYLLILWSHFINSILWILPGMPTIL